jgi:hypothetical protein
LSVIKLACPFCKRDYLLSDVVGVELVAAEQVQRVHDSVERSLTSHARDQRRLLIGLGAAVLAALGGLAALLASSPEPAKEPRREPARAALAKPAPMPEPAPPAPMVATWAR